MVVKKDDLVKLNPDDVKYLREVEIFIDAWLAIEFRETVSPISYATVSFREIQKASGVDKLPNHIVLGVIRARYEGAGWTVQIEHDQRDGDWIKFS